MKIFLLSDKLDTLLGMRLVGVEGRHIQDTHEFLKEFEAVVSSKNIGILLITQALYDEFEETVNIAKASVNQPLIAFLPDGGSIGRGESFISKYISQAIGVAGEARV